MDKSAKLLVHSVTLVDASTSFVPQHAFQQQPTVISSTRPTQEWVPSRLHDLPVPSFQNLLSVLILQGMHSKRTMKNICRTLFISSVVLFTSIKMSQLLHSDSQEPQGRLFRDQGRLQMTVAPAAGVATPLLGPAVLTFVPLRYTPSDSSGMVPSTKINRLLKIETKRKPAKTVSERLSWLPRLIWFQSESQNTIIDQYTAAIALRQRETAHKGKRPLTVTPQHAQSSDH